MNLKTPVIFCKLIYGFVRQTSLLLYEAGIRFNKNKNFLHANSIAFSLLISVIPFLTVMIKYADIDRDIIRTALAQTLSNYGLPEATELLVIIDGILNRANAIAGVGTLFIIFAATNAIRHLEDASNHIFHTQHRPPLYRYSVHIASLVLIPGLLFLSGRFLGYIFQSLKPAQYVSIAADNNRAWIATNSGIILSVTDGKMKQIDLSEKIERAAPFRDIYYNLATGQSGKHFEMKITNEPFRISSNDFLLINKIVVKNGMIYATTSSGVMFFSKDGGGTWDYRIFGFLSNASTKRVSISDFALDKEGTPFILTGFARESFLIYGENDSFQYRRLPTLYDHLFFFESTDHAKYEPGFYVTGAGRYAYSPDGRHWSGSKNASFANRLFNISTLVFFNHTACFAGHRGTFWLETENEKVYPDLRLRDSGIKENINNVIVSPYGIIVYGERGLLRYSRDNGNTWHKTDQVPLGEITIIDHAVLNNGTVLLIGENETLIQLQGASLAPEKDVSGFSLSRFRFTQLHSRLFLLSLLYTIFVYGTGFILVVGVLFAIYMLFPNIPVQPAAALYGAVFTSSLIISFVFLFRLWITTFNPATYLYGGWAFVPMGMIGVLIFVQFILYGLEITCILHTTPGMLTRSGVRAPKRTTASKKRKT